MTTAIRPPEAQLPRWDLTRLYASLQDERLERDLETAQREADQLAKTYRGRLAELSPEALRSFFESFEELLVLIQRPVWFASLSFAAKTDDPNTQALLSKTQECATAVFNTLAFVKTELTGLDDDAAKRFLSAAELSEFHHELEAILRFRSHTLSEAEERLISTKNLSGRSAWTQLYTESVSKLRITLDVDGSPTLTIDEARALERHPNRELRRAARNGIFSTLAAHEHTLTSAFNAIFQDWKLEIQLRGYSDPIEPTALGDELTVQSVDALMETTEANYPLAQKFFTLKAKLLGLSDFSSFDVHAPLDDSEQTVSFAEAKDLVLGAFADFSPSFEARARRFFDEVRIDVPTQPGKRGGAFCSSLSPKEPSFILLNFTNQLEDVFTLAHELGHGLHAEFSSVQRLTNYHAPLPLAETASVFSELLLLDRLLQGADRTSQRALLAKQLQKAVTTIMRQVQITRWERRAHAERAHGMVTSTRYGELWLEEYNRLYGNAVRPSEHERWDWIGIPHVINSRFYCYSYAFGMLLSLALFGQYKLEGKSFASRFEAFLASGGSDSPQALVAKLGLDLNDPSFWQTGFDHLGTVLEAWQKTLEPPH